MRLAHLLATFALPASLIAQEPSAKPAEESLGGPRVVEKAKKPTLVELDMTGKVKRLEMQPAEAAVRKLKLSDATRAKADKVLAEHAAAMDKLVRDNLKTIVSLAGARAADKKDEVKKLMGELMEAAGPIKDRGRLLIQLTSVLSEDEKTEMRRMTSEYFTAVVKEKTDEAGGEGKADMRDLMRTEFFAFLGVEISRAYERVVGQQSKDFDALLKTLTLSPEQEGKVRKIVGDSFTATYGKATPTEKARVFREVYELLTADQREILNKSIK